MLFWLTLALSALFSFVYADVKFTSPAAGATISGTSINIKWSDSGTAPLLSSLQSYQLFLCAGGNDPSSITPLATLVTDGDYGDGNSFTATIQPTLGGNTKNAYFLKMISAATGGSVINYSSRFTITSMTGTFSDAIQTALKSVSGTAGPASQNQIVAAADAATAAQGDFAVPYTMQMGPTRFAPMAKRPGTKITKKKHSPQYPASSYSVWKEVGGTPNAVFTLTQQDPNVISSMEPTFAAAPVPSDSDMQKFLNRWRD